MNYCQFEILSYSFKLDSISTGEAGKKNNEVILFLMWKQFICLRVGVAQL